MPFFISKAFVSLLAQLADTARADEQLHRERANTLERQLAVAVAENDTLVRQNAVHRNNTEWLQHLVNTLNQERAERVHLAMQRRGEDVFGDRIEALPTDTTPKRDPAKDRVEEALVEASSGAAIFEDMGNLAAEAQGVRWDAGGGVEHTKR